MPNPEQGEFPQNYDKSIQREKQEELVQLFDQAAEVISGFDDSTRLQGLAYLSYTDPVKRNQIMNLPSRSESEDQAEMRDCTTWVDFLSTISVPPHTRKEFVTTINQSAKLTPLGISTVGQLRETIQNTDQTSTLLQSPYIKVSHDRRLHLVQLFRRPKKDDSL